MPSNIHIRCGRWALALLSAVTAASPATPTPAPAQASAPTTTQAPSACIPEGNGSLRARLRGAVDLDLDWTNAEMLCDGGPRPDGSGLRVSIAGPDRGGGRRLRFVFGINGVREGQPARNRPTNLTIVFDGEQRIFATRGAERCITDSLEQQRLGTPGGSEHRWRITARGFCIGPAATIAQDARILVSRFDLTSQVTFRDDRAPSPPPPAAPAAPRTDRPR